MNANDLHTFIHGLFGNKVVSAASLAQMTSTIPTGQPNVSAGLGLFAGNGNLGAVFNHNGSLPGYRAAWYYYPGYDVSVVVLINTNTDPSAGQAQNEALQFIQPMLPRL
jgi:CubicO group peptidase (beta-lactamase class C family)